MNNLVCRSLATDQQWKESQEQDDSFVNNSLFENQAVSFVASLAAALLGGEPLVSLLGDGQTDSLSSGQGHPRLVALQMRAGWGVNLD